jgi:hypothetical protein
MEIAVGSSTRQPHRHPEEAITTTDYPDPNIP